MVTELQNKFNFVVTQRIKKYLMDKGLTDLLTQFNDQGGYTKFIIVYNFTNFDNKNLKFYLLFKKN
jgi:hypothetical protein